MFDLKITFECPHCKQINEGVAFKEAIEIEQELEYIGSGDYVVTDNKVYVKCSGCKVKTSVEV